MCFGSGRQDGKQCLIVWWLHYVKSLKQELGGRRPKNYKPWLVYVYDYTYHSATEFDVSVKEDLDKLPTLYWLPKLHTRSYKSRLIAKSSSCTTTKLSKCLTSCFTVTRKDVIKYCDKFYDRSGKNLFSSIKNSNEVLNKLKPRSFRASSLFRYVFSTLYTTLSYKRKT